MFTAFGVSVPLDAMAFSTLCLVEKFTTRGDLVGGCGVIHAGDQRWGVRGLRKECHLRQGEAAQRRTEAA